MYVQRNQEGVITGAFANMQPGYAEEYLQDDDPELLAFLYPPPPIPTEVTMRQAQFALLDAGYLDAVEAAIAVIPGIPGRKAQIEWKTSNTVKRNQPLTLMLAAEIGLTSQQIDDLFVTAATL